MVGTIVAFNTKDLIFMYPFSIPFVLTNFQNPITTDKVIISLISLLIINIICIPSIVITFKHMDI